MTLFIYFKDYNLKHLNILELLNNTCLKNKFIYNVIDVLMVFCKSKCVFTCMLVCDLAY